MSGDVEATLADRFDRWVETLSDLVRIRSISASAERADEIAQSADAVAAVLEGAGLEHVHQASIGDSWPYVIGDWIHHDDRPTVLFYAHHDVQPPGIVSNWNTDPFEPVLDGDRLYGRGSADDKAGVVAHAAAVRAWLDAAGELPCNVRVLVEGEEEIGSPHLESFLRAHLDDLRADILVLADAGNWKQGIPGLTYSLRGLASADVTVRALRGPVHSGSAGGVAPDPVMAMAKLLAGLTDDRGELAVEGFTDDVRPPSDDELARMRALPADGEGRREAYGILPRVETAGDPERTIYEKMWTRPAITVIGFDSHPIAGSSNQIVAQAKARLSVRLAPGQDPERANRLLEDHLRSHVPWGLDFSYEPGDAAPAWVCAPTGPAFDAAERALRAGFGAEVVYMGEGGSIPFVGPFAEAFGGIPALLLGPADPTSAIHGENESVHLGDLRSLALSEALLLRELVEP